MKYQFKPNFFNVVIALIVGGALFQQFDFETLKFEKTVLSLIYVAVFIICLYSMFKKSDK